MIKMLRIIPLALLSMLTLTSCTQKTEKSAVNNEEFPLTVDLEKYDYKVGEKLLFKATITNQSGKEVKIASNGQMPCAYFRPVDDTGTHAETTVMVEQTLKADETITRPYLFSLTKAGKYLLDVHYSMDVDGVPYQANLKEITITVK